MIWLRAATAARGSASLIAIAMAALPAVASAQEADPSADAATGEVTDDGGTPEIIVTGFRKSLDAALNVKRDAIAAVDAIVAEDIAKFPDQNLAESLQRIPGVAISREGGEGNQITVRGLGGEYTKVTLNGLETVAAATVNRGRGFDFNIFASDLFRSLVVHKTAEANLDEGSLGAVVDLNTGNPLSYKDGLTLVGSAKVQYNDLNDNVGPRVAALLAWKDPGGVWAASVSAAYAKYKTLEAGNNTVRWQQARFNSVNGTPCFTQNRSGGTYVPSAACNDVALAFHPRIPRYGQIEFERERLGLTGSFEIKPFDGTDININALYAKYTEDRREKYAEVLFRGNERGIDVLNPVIDSTTNNLVSGTFNNAWVRIEDYYRQSKNSFYQFSGSIDQEFSDTFKATLIGGISRSEADVPFETTIIFDDRDMNGYSYDYSQDSRAPKLTFADSITDPSSFQFAEFRDRPSNVVNDYKTVKLNTQWDAAEGFTILAGGIFREFNFDSRAGSRDSTYCAAFACAPGTYGMTVTPDMTETYTLPNVGNVPAGTTTSFVVPNLGYVADMIDLYGRPLNRSAGDTRSVRERTTGGYLQFNIKGDLLGLEYAANAGIRYVHTSQRSIGINNAQTIGVSRSYDDWLPSVNLAVYPTSKLIVRGAIAKVMRRPGLGTLSPGGSVDGFNYRVSFGNPQLDPTRATTYDLSVEWYFARESLISVALFKKDIESFPIGQTIIGTYASTGLPLSLIIPSSPAAADPEGQPWQIATTINGPGASIKGVEVGLQLPFTFLPAPLDGFGFTGNVTYVDSKTRYSLFGAATNPTPMQPLTFPVLTEVQVTERLLGLSKWSANATLYYEKDKLAVRSSLAYRSGYLDTTGGNGNVFDGFHGTVFLDASVSYQFTDWLQVRVDGNNLLDTYQNSFTDQDADRNYSYQHTGRVIQLGARVTF